MYYKEGDIIEIDTLVKEGLSLVKEEGLTKYEELTLESLLITYMIMTRKQDDIVYLSKNLTKMIRSNKDDLSININYPKYLDYIIDYLYNKNESLNIIDNYLNNGYLFHTFNSGFTSDIMNNGLRCDLIEPKMDLVNKIFLSHGKKDIFGLSKNSLNQKIFLASSLKSSAYYGINSPSWFRTFIEGGFSNRGKVSFDINNYSKALELVNLNIKKYNLAKEESLVVLDFFNYYYNLLITKEYPKIALVKRNKISSFKILERLPNEDDKSYLKRLIHFNTENDYIIRENINKEDITIISYISLEERRKIRI